MTHGIMCSYNNEQDLDEDVVITLVARNPQAPQNKIRFDHTTGSFITQRLTESMIDHLEIESTCVHKDSLEAKSQKQVEHKETNGNFYLKTVTYIQRYKMECIFFPCYFRTWIQINVAKNC